MKEANHQNLKHEFAQAYEDYSDAIFRYCYMQVKNRSKSKDITQDTFIKTWEYLSSGKEVENLRAFLYRVAKNLIIDDSRKKKSSSLEEMTENGFDVKSDKDEIALHESHFEKQATLDLINRLKPKYRDVIVFRFVEDMSVKAIAEMLGESENNISVRIHRGLDKLRDIIEEI